MEKNDIEKEYIIMLLADIYYDKSSILWNDLKKMAFSLWNFSYRKTIRTKKTHNKFKRISLYLYKIYYQIIEENNLHLQFFENKNNKEITLAQIEEYGNLFSEEIKRLITELDKSISKIKAVEGYRNRYVMKTFNRVISIENGCVQYDFENLYGNKMLSYMYGIDISEGETFSRCKQINFYLELHNKEITYSKNKNKELLLENCVRIY